MARQVGRLKLGSKPTQIYVRHSIRPLHRIVAKLLDCNIVASRFELQLHYYIRFQTNTLEKSMAFSIPMLCLNNTTSVISQGWPCHNITHKILYTIEEEEEEEEDRFENFFS